MTERAMYEEQQYYVYIMTNNYNNVLYTGMTNDLTRRVWEHKEKEIKGFTSRYRIIKLVYYEILNTPSDAIAREKQIKGGSRQKKIDLIVKANPMWKDLCDDGEIEPLDPIE
jgi:putative endonuclease